MKIAIDARAAAEVPAGRGRYVRELLRGLNRLNVDHEFLLYARERWTGGDLDERFTWHTFDAPGLLWPLSAGVRMSRAADVALACTSYAMTARWRIPGAAIVWDFAPFRREMRTPRGSLLERVTLPLAVRRCATLIAISQATRAELEQRFASTRGRTVVAPPAADARFSAAPDAEDESVLARCGLRKPYVLVTGTLEPRKNLPRLIEAFAGIDEGLRGGWTLALAGTAGWETDATFASVTSHGDLVRTLGFVPDEELACLYRQAGVFCYPSLYEGFGIPVLEAMQSGAPVLTSSVSSMPEVGGEAVCYADPYDVDSIRASLSTLLAGPGLRERMALAGVERARAFDWATTAKTVLATLEGLGT